jgi:hypothetical protein
VHVLQPIGHVYKQLLLKSLYPELHALQVVEVQTAQFAEHATQELEDR